MDEEKALNGVVKHHGLVQVSSWCELLPKAPQKSRAPAGELQNAEGTWLCLLALPLAKRLMGRFMSSSWGLLVSSCFARHGSMTSSD